MEYRLKDHSKPSEMEIWVKQGKRVNFNIDYTPKSHRDVIPASARQTFVDDTSLPYDPKSPRKGVCDYKDSILTSATLWLWVERQEDYAIKIIRRTYNISIRPYVVKGKNTNMVKLELTCKDVGTRKANSALFLAKRDLENILQKHEKDSFSSRDITELKGSAEKWFNARPLERTVYLREIPNGRLLLIGLNSRDVDKSYRLIKESHKLRHVPGTVVTGSETYRTGNKGSTRQKSVQMPALLWQYLLHVKQAETARIIKDYTVTPNYIVETNDVLLTVAPENPLASVVVQGLEMQRRKHKDEVEYGKVSLRDHDYAGVIDEAWKDEREFYFFREGNKVRIVAPRGMMEDAKDRVRSLMQPDAASLAALKSSINIM